MFHHRTAFTRRSGRLGEGVKSRNFCWQQWEIKGYHNVHVFKGQQICIYISLSSSAVFAYVRLLELFLRGSWSVMLDHAGGGWRFPTMSGNSPSPASSPLISITTQEGPQEEEIQHETRVEMGEYFIRSKTVRMVSAASSKA